MSVVLSLAAGVCCRGGGPGRTGPATPGAGQAPRTIRFNRDIRPILSDKCFQCHGPDATQRKGKLRLDSLAAATAPAGSGSPAIVPGKVDESELYERITSPEVDVRMPPAKTGKPLTPGEIQKLKTWIEEGAEYEAHWAFIPPVRPEVPAVRNRAWVRNPIDAFILARLEKEGLSPSPEADPTTLIRRLSLDLIGLPPPSRRWMHSSPIAAATRWSGSSSGCWTRRTTASAGDGSGSTPRGMPTPTATRRTSRARSTSIATG